MKTPEQIVAIAVLKSRIKGAAEAKRTLRSIARKADGRPCCFECKEPWTKDHTHGGDADLNQSTSIKCRLKQEAATRLKNPRLMLLAYGYLRGRTYQQIESNARELPVPEGIRQALLDAGMWVRRDTEEIRSWLKNDLVTCHTEATAALP